MSVANSKKSDMKRRNDILETLEKLDDIDTLHKNMKIEFNRTNKRARKSNNKRLNFNVDLVGKTTHDKRNLKVERKKIVDQEVPLRAKRSSYPNLVGSTIALSEEVSSLREENEMRLDELDRTIDEFRRRGRRWKSQILIIHLMNH